MEKPVMKEASPEQLKTMQEFAQLSSDQFALVLKYENNMALQQTIIKINEAMFWFHSYLINDGKLLPAAPTSAPELSAVDPASEAVN